MKAELSATDVPPNFMIAVFITLPAGRFQTEKLKEAGVSKSRPTSNEI